MAGFLSNVESILKQQGEAGLEHLLYYNGIDFNWYRDVKDDIYSQVHRQNSGGPLTQIGQLEGVIAGDDFFEADDAYSGNFEEGFLFTKTPDILVGDIISIVSEDLKSRRYKIESIEQLGLTKEIFTKYKIINMGA